MGKVYRARDPVLDREVALKTISREVLDRPDARQRFKREARLAARLQHPNIVTIYELGEVDGVPYIAFAGKHRKPDGSRSPVHDHVFREEAVYASLAETVNEEAESLYYKLHQWLLDGYWVCHMNRLVLVNMISGQKLSSARVVVAAT